MVGPVTIAGGNTKPIATPSWSPKTPTQVAVETSSTGNQMAARRGGTSSRKGIASAESAWPSIVSHAREGEAEKHFKMAPTAFKPEPIITITRRLVYSNKSVAGI